jgi:membrane fusion protein, multidrug efflux system
MRLPGLLLLLLLLLCLAVPAAAEDQPSVLVATIKAERGAEPETLTAYGSAIPLPSGSTALSLLRAGQVVGLAVTAGQAVKKGDLLLQFAADPAAIMAWEQAVSALALAREERTNTEQLLKQRLATRAQLAQADKAVSDAEAALDALRRQGGDKAVENLTAPFDGIVTGLTANSGDRVQAGAPLLILARRDALAITIGIEPAFRTRLRRDQKVRLVPLDGGLAIEGSVAEIGAMLNPKTRMVDVIVAVPPKSVLPGQGFQAVITTGRIEGWLTPRDTVLSDEQGEYLFQIAGGKAVRVPVHLLGSAGDTDVVDGPLDPRRPLVVQGNYQLSDGMAVREKAAEEGAISSDEKSGDGKPGTGKS